MLEIVPSTVVEVSWNITTYYMNIYTCVLDDIRRLTTYIYIQHILMDFVFIKKSPFWNHSKFLLLSHNLVAVSLEFTMSNNSTALHKGLTVNGALAKR